MIDGFAVPPSEPSKPKVTMITKSTMTVIWERPALDGGSDIDGYYLEKREKKSLQWFKVCLMSNFHSVICSEKRLESGFQMSPCR